LTTAAPIEGSYETTDDDVGLLLHDVKLQLRRQADVKVKRALEVGVRSLAEQTPDEIRASFGLTFSEYGDAVAWLKEAIRGTSPESR